MYGGHIGFCNVGEEEKTNFVENDFTVGS